MLITRSTLQEPKKEIPEVKKEEIKTEEVKKEEPVLISSVFSIKKENDEEIDSEKIVESLCILLGGTDNFELITEAQDLISKTVRKLEIRREIFDLENELKTLESNE